MHFGQGHLAYCTNIHPAESWEETRLALATHTLRVRDLVASRDTPFAIGLRLSARAASELLDGDRLAAFRAWLAAENCYVFTVNGFPYGTFHGARVKENVYRPDWTEPTRLEYTKQLFTILSALLPDGVDGSVSTLPGSFKAFAADESLMLDNLVEMADFLEAMSECSGRDLHLGLEPEPLGHFENTAETLRFFDRLLDAAPDHERIKRRIGVNYDTCHFALEYEDARESLDAFRNEGLRLSKIHLSAALALDPGDPAAVRALAAFDEPVYLHQVMALAEDGSVTRFTDIPDALAAAASAPPATEWRVHFHVPLDREPLVPLASTCEHAASALAWVRQHPAACRHLEIETYTWSVLPPDMRRPVEEQIAAEYQWVLAQT